MLYRKIINNIENYFKSKSNKMLIVDSVRQVGKSFIIRYVGEKMFPNYIEVNMEKDRQKDRLFANAKTVEDFYMVLSMIAGDKMGQRDDTLVFIDEIQAYDHLLTMVKFLMEDGRFTYIASGSQLGVALKTTQSIPIGSLEIEHLYPLDFEEFLIANNVGTSATNSMRESFKELKPLPEAVHNKVMNLFRTYLLIGGMPAAVNVYLAEHNIVSVRKVQKDIHTLYGRDTAKYKSSSNKKLNIQRIYDMIPSNLENKKIRAVLQSKVNNISQ